MGIIKPILNVSYINIVDLVLETDQVKKKGKAVNSSILPNICHDFGELRCWTNGTYPARIRSHFGYTIPEKTHSPPPASQLMCPECSADARRNCCIPTILSPTNGLQTVAVERF